MPNLSNDFEVRKETLRALGGNPDGLANIYEVDLEILKLIGSSEQGIPDAPIDGVQYARQDGTWTPVESGVDWNTIKQKLAEDGVESIKFNIQVPIESRKYVGFEEGAMPFSTGHTITTNTRVQMKFRCLKGTDNAFIGMRMYNASDNRNKWRFVRLGGDNAFQQICDYDGEYRCTVWNINPDNWYELEIGNCYIKDVQTGEILAQNTKNESGSWGELVFNACRGEKGDIEYVKVFEGDELVRDYIAAADEEGNIGFYESLSNTFTIAHGWQRSENNDWTTTYYVQGEVILTGDELKTLLNQQVIPDAPSDGKQYARQDGNWTPVESVEPGIPDAPSDGTQYARQNGNWTPVEEGLTDSPSDGKTYGRNNGTWTTVKEGISDAPSDGKTYGRNNGAWTPVEEGLTDAPSDGKQYARQDGNWTSVKEGISDAPSDGTQYARQDGAWVPVQTPTEGKYITITADESNTGETIIHPNIEGSLPNLNLQYRINNGKWNDFIVGTTDDIKIGAGDVLQFKGDNKEGVSTYSNHLNFAISGNPVSLSGNIMSLIDGVGETLVIPNEYCFHALFRNSVIKTVSSDFLPATTLKASCYRDLFSGCQNLTQAPELPATTLAEGCYNGMFYACSKLVNATELPAKVLVDGCYGYMFTYCNALNYVKCLATEGTINGDGTVPSALDNWLQGVASTGTFEKLSGVSYEAGGNGLPEGWTVKEIYDYVEAPLDGQQYARQNGTWTVVEGITDSPSDGKTYGRNNGAWTVVTEGITDSPSDGKQYARQNGNWTPVEEGLPDAPTDGQQYARQDGSWTVVESVEPGISDAPSDGKTYGRNNGNWTTVKEGISDAPSDGTQYARQDGAWTPVEEGIPEAPLDGQKYSRKNAAWTPVEEGIHEAPLDGTQYSRQEGAWVEVEPSKVKTTKDTTLKFWDGTQQEYDAIATKDANTLYIIK